MRWSSGSNASLGARLALASVVLVLVQASTCENQDYLLPPAPLVLTDAAPGAPVVVEIDVPVRGLTSMDFTIINNGAAGADFTVAASGCVSCRFDSDCPGDVTCEDSGFCSEVDPTATPCGTPVDATLRTGPLGREVGIADRFAEGDLGLIDHLHVEFACIEQPCSGTLDYTLLVRQAECQDDTDCASDEVCDLELGFCRTDASASGCQVATSPPSSGHRFPIWLWAIGFLAFRRRRPRDGDASVRQWSIASRPRGGFRGARSFALKFLLLTGVLLASFAAREVAAQPADFRRTQVYIHPTVQVNRFVGRLQDLSGWGIGMGVTQGVQFGWFGLNVTLDTDFYLGRQAVPPFTRGLQHAAVRLAARASYPVGTFRLIGELGGQRLSFISNALVEETGNALAYHAIGVAAGLRFDGLHPLYFELRTDADYFLDLDDSWLFGIGISVGVRSLL